ncbi:hypothetical protein EC968_000973 [Mortierella alpina]|nr:hypothetical protein EC968_000973 [Mortierella alpina]
MPGLVSTSTGAVPVNIMRAAVPVGIGLASAAYLTLKMASQTVDKSIPTVALRSGNSTHDAEYKDDPDLFLSRCEEEYGPVFNLYILNQHLTVISGPMVREVFMNEDFDFSEAANGVIGLRSFTTSIIKSNRDPDNTQLLHDVIRETVSPNLPLFTPRIVEQLISTIDNSLGHCDHKLVENPLLVFQDMNASAMATVFMGPEVARNSKVINTFIQCTYDFGKALGKDSRKSFWRSFQNNVAYLTANLLYYLAAFPEHMDTLFQEKQRVLDEIAKQREEQRQSKLRSGETHSSKDFEGTDLDPKMDRDLSAAAMKRMVHVDSFVREVFRYRWEIADLLHLARKTVVLSNGMTIHKGRMTFPNLRSVHINNQMQGEDSTEFRPWRFVGKAKAATKVGTFFCAFAIDQIFAFPDTRVLAVF